MSEIEGKRPFVIIGTSGSPDYLKDTTGDRRYWSVPTEPVEDPSAYRAQADADALLESICARSSRSSPAPARRCIDVPMAPITTKKEP